MNKVCKHIEEIQLTLDRDSLVSDILRRAKNEIVRLEKQGRNDLVDNANGEGKPAF